MNNLNDLFSCFYSSSSSCLFVFYSFPSVLSFYLLSCSFASCPAPLFLVLPIYLLSYSFASCPASFPLVSLLYLLSCPFTSCPAPWLLVLILCLLSCSFTSCPAPLILILHSSSVVFKSEHNIFLFKRQMWGLWDTPHSCIRPCVNALLPFPLFSSFCILLLPYLLFSSTPDLFLFLFICLSPYYICSLSVKPVPSAQVGLYHAGLYRQYSIVV